MNCRSFEHQVADWLAGRLPAESARRLREHRQACGSCARLADAEEHLRDGWRAMSATSAPDFWPRLSLRLEERRQPQRRPAPVRRGWALGGTAVLAAVTVGGVLLWPKPSAPTRTAPPERIVVARPAAVSALPDVAQVDPAVDDPVGTSMQNVWTQIDTAAPRTDGR